MKPILLGLVVAVVLACGGGSGGDGVPGTTRIVDLDGEQIRAICPGLAERLGPERTIDCGDGVTITVGAGEDEVDDCIEALEGVGQDAPACPVTVAQFEDCLDAQGAQSDAEARRDDVIPEECSFFLNPDCG